MMGSCSNKQPTKAGQRKADLKEHFRREHPELWQRRSDPNGRRSFDKLAELTESYVREYDDYHR